MSTPPREPANVPPVGAPPVREARLKPEFAALYPGLVPGSWLSAGLIADTILTGLVSPPGSASRIDARLLDDAHFEFRGGGGPSRPRRDSRDTAHD